MDLRSFIYGGLAGALVTSIVSITVGTDAFIEFALDDSKSPDEVSTLQSETLGLRQLALPAVIDKPVAILLDLGAVEISDVRNSDVKRVRFDEGLIFLSVEDGRVADILTYCWRWRYNDVCAANGET